MTDAPPTNQAPASGESLAAGDTAAAFAQVNATVEQLIGDGGCAWHQEQTHDSLTPFLVEETAELVDAIDQKLPQEELITELGDVLYQVLFHTAIAQRDGEGFSTKDVLEHLDTKLKARHPHVFGDRGYMTVDELNAEWEQLKEDAKGQQRGTRGVLEGIPAAMPTLAKAAKTVNRLTRAGLWQLPTAPEPSSTVTGQTRDAIEQHEAEIGNALLQLVALAHDQGIDPDRALRIQLARHAANLTADHTSKSMEE